MNERIRELAEQAGLKVNADGEIGPAYFGSVDSGYRKFAELIVKECMTIAKNWEDQLENANCISESNAVGIVVYRIARQFGVKQ